MINRLDHVLQKWIDMDGQATPVNWKTIIGVLKEPLVREIALVKEICQDLKQESSKEDKTTSKNI